MNDEKKKWYVLRTASGKEKKAKEYLEKEIERKGLSHLVDNLLVPTESYFKVVNGKRIAAERVLYPSYVLINAILSRELQYIIRNEVPGMSGFLTEGRGKTEPVPMRDEEVNRILGLQDQMLSGELSTQIDFVVGEPVKITDGPFTGFEATVEEIIEDRCKLKVSVTIFGHKTPLELNFTQVAKE